MWEYTDRRNLCTLERERGDSTQKEELEEGVSRVWTRVEATTGRDLQDSSESRGLGLVRVGPHSRKEEDYSRRESTAGGHTHTPTPVGTSGCSRCSGCSGGSGCS